jgi:hypothetical protein
MPIELKLKSYTAFEVSPQAFSEAPNTATRTEFLLMEKQELLEFQKSH